MESSAGSSSTDLKKTKDVAETNSKEEGFDCWYCDDVLATGEEIERHEIGTHGALKLCLPIKKKVPEFGELGESWFIFSYL